MNLKSKKSDLLVRELKSLVQRERETTTEILHYLKETEARRIHLEQGYPSLFEWCVSVLGYSTGATHRRIQSMKLLKTLPELEEKITSGELSLSAAAQAQSFFRREDQKRKQENQATLTVEAKREIAQSLIGASSRECERKLAAISPESAEPKEKMRAISEEKTLIQFVADAELLGKLEKLKGLFAHQNFDGRLDVLIHQLADLALKKLAPKIPTSEKPAASAPQAQQVPQPPRTRHIPAALKREVWAREQGRCSYRDPKTGRVCRSDHAIEYEHLQPYAWGGEHTLDNLTLRCSSHNRYAAEKLGLVRPKG